MLDRPAGRTRMLREDVRRKRAALLLLSPLIRQIGPWQASAARLQGVAERLKSRGTHSPHAIAEVEALAQMVKTQYRRIFDETETLPIDVIGTSTLDDTRRALKSVAASLERTQILLGRRQEG